MERMLKRKTANSIRLSIGPQEKPELGLQVLHILLSSPGIIVSVADNDGRQPLLWAASAGSARAVLALVRAGAAVEASDRDGLTALHCAASRGHTDTLDTLLTLCGAQTDVIDSNGCTALHYSVTLGHADATALLLSHCADPNLQDRKGRSPAHCGCAKGQLETVRQLHASGANLWLRTARGDLPLHEAAASGRRQLVRWLLDQRPSQVNSRNNDGRGLLHLAALNDNADMCKILLDSGVAVNPLLRTSKNVFMTPLDCALQRGFRSTAKFLQLHGGVPASRLNTLRLTSELATNVTSGSHLHIRDDITILGGSSSETDLDDTHKTKDHRGRRKTVRRKLSYRHERRRSFSGSEIQEKSSSKSVHKKKYEAERRAKSRDDVNKIKDGHKKKKKLEIESEDSLSETETPPEIRKDKDKRKHISDVETQKPNTESIKKIIPPDYERSKSRKSHHDDTSHEISDREKRKSKKQTKEEEYHDDDTKNKRNSQSSNGEQEISNHESIQHEEHLAEEKTKKKLEDVQDKKQNKSKKSDISDSDTQKNKMSDSERERRKKKSADKKSQKEKSIEENLSQEKESLDEEAQENKKENIKQKSANLSKEKQSLEKEPQEIKNGKINQKSASKSKSSQEELEKQLHSQDENDFAKNSKQELNSEEMKSSAEDTTKEAGLLEQEPEATKHLEDTEQLQPDQISLQSKLSEESPSKTIVVEAAVHPPPKGMTTENIQEEQPAIVDDKEDNKETAEEVLDTTQETKIEAETTIEEGTETSKTEIKSEEETDKSVLPPEIPEHETAVASEEANATAEVDSQDIINEEANATAEVDSQNKDVTKHAEEIDNSCPVEEKNISNTEPIVTNGTEITQNVANEIKETEQEPSSEHVKTVENGITEESSTVDTKEVSETATTETEDQKKEETDSKKELNIDLSLKTFEESAELQNEVTDVDETVSKGNEVVEETKQKKYRKKVRISKNKDKKDESSTTKPEGTEQAEDGKETSSTSRETSSSESESGKSVKKISDKNSEHKSFKILNDDVAFEVLKESSLKESRRMRKNSKKRHKEAERLNESATSSPEMLESVRTRSKSVPRQKESTHTVTLPSLVEKRPESNLSAPNLSSVYSDNEQKSGSNSEVDDLMSSASRKKRLKRRSKLRVGSKSAGSDYESSNLIDSGFEPSPRSSRIPKRKVMSERGVNMTSVTQQIQSNIRKYHMERKIFQHLLDLKRLQIRSGQANESVLVKRAIDTYHNSVAASVGAGRYLKKDYSYRSFEQFLYQSLRMLQKSPADHMKGLPETTDNPLLCTQSTHRCLHATHAYTGIPCAAYLPKMNHHTMPKIGFTPRSSSSFLPQINSKGKSVTLELCHGNDKQVISLPADRLDHNKRYYVTFTVKGQEGQSPVDQENTPSHRHAKSV